MGYLVFDIETIVSQEISPEMLEAFAETIKTGNIKDQAKIDEKINKKLGTDKDMCQVCTFVGYAHTKETVIKRVLQWPPLDEYEVVSGAWDFIKHAYNDKIPLVTFGGNGFDLPVLYTAAMRLDIPVSRSMYEAITYRYENDRHYDLMRSLTGEIHPVTGKNLDFYLGLYKLGSKTPGMDGSLVYPAWKNGEYKLISDYCERDVEMTGALFERVSPWIRKANDTSDGEIVIDEEDQKKLDEAPWEDAK